MPAPREIVKRVFRRLRGQPSATAGPAATAETTLLSMIERIRQSPLDASLCFELAVELLRKGIDTDGVRYLDRSFRLDPLNVVRFVETPELKQVRLRKSVVSLLSRMRREEEHRNYTAYV